MDSHSFEAFGMPSRGRLFVMNALIWAPEGSVTRMFERDKSPGMVNLRKNREYAHEVAAKLIEEKRQELRDGTSRKDLLSLLGPSCVPSMDCGALCNVRLFSQGEFYPAARMAAE